MVHCYVKEYYLIQFFSPNPAHAFLKQSLYLLAIFDISDTESFWKGLPYQYIATRISFLNLTICLGNSTYSNTLLTVTLFFETVHVVISQLYHLFFFLYHGLH